MVRIKLGLLFLVLSLLAAACGNAGSDTVDTATNIDEATSSETQPTPAPTATPDGPPVEATIDPATVPTGEGRDFSPAPDVPTGDLSADTTAAIDTLMGQRLLDRIIDQRSFDAIDTLGASGDPRVSWWLSDMMRVANNPTLTGMLVDAQKELLGIELDAFRSWGDVTDHLIAWDIPAPPDYLKYKRNAYIVVEPKWDRLFVEDANIDWRILSWGGVLIDDRPYDTTDNPCNCIPAADNPETTDVAVGDSWLGEETIVFGVSIDGEHRAYPRSIMEVREMVNDTLGGRDFAMPYCTLCGSAQVFFTDEVPEGIDRPILRTSGLLSRSNKVMYDVNTFSIFDTFLGEAVSGPLFEAGIELSQNSVITTTWGQWKTDHPDTTVLDISEALGRPDSDLRNTRDADGPIFPIGDVDDRLPVQEDVLGLLTADGDPIAFHVKSAIDALERGEFIAVDGINIVLDGGGVKAVDDDGNDLGGHQAFWFAWSQFYTTLVDSSVASLRSSLARNRIWLSTE